MLENTQPEQALDQTATSRLYEEKPLSTGWSFRRQGAEEWHSATVPGCNFTDLLQNNLIEDPFRRCNENDLQWIEKENWEYRAAFQLTSEDLTYAHAELQFDGLDTFAEIQLNGTPILQTNNMFRSWRHEVKDLLREGGNELHILFLSPLKYAVKNEEIAPFLYPAGNDHSDENLSVYIRKAPYHFGWDWGPRFVTSGIWRPVSLLLYEQAQITETQILSTLREDTANVELKVEVACHQALEGQLLVRCLNEDLGLEPQSVTLEAGANSVSYQFQIDDCKKWWPRGLGDPYLYKLSIQLQVGEHTISTWEEQLGLRTVEVVNEPDEWGESFYFKVNGFPLFMKGANYIPQDSFLDQAKEDRYRQVFEDAADANFNMLRIWGGGIYEEDRFYELADEYGILIWQDFMFACTMYPSYDSFVDNVREEAIQNVKRLRNHPSIAIWCGNNEIHMGWHHWGWQEEFKYDDKTQETLWKGYLEVFEELLASVVQAHDPQRFYLPSSPISNWEQDVDFTIGDNHYWGVWHGEAPFSEYKKRIPRFMSEFGFQSFPLFQSVQRYTNPPDWYLTSEVMMLHQKHPRGNELIRKYLLQEYKKPKDFESFLYASQVLQSAGISMAIEAHRRNKPYCMGTLYWQFNDCWPVASWSSIDYYGQWKALHYSVKKLYSDLLISCDVSAKEIDMYLINDLPQEHEVSYRLTLLDFQGQRLNTYEGQVVLKGNESRPTLKVPIVELLGTHDKDKVVVEATLLQNGETVSRNHYLLAPPKDLKLLIPTFETEVIVQDDHLEVSITTNTFAMGVYLEFEQLRGNFSDNFFDLLPGEKKVVTFPRQAGGTDEPKLIVKSLRDTYL